jgi:cytochrome P450
MMTHFLILNELGFVRLLATSLAVLVTLRLTYAYIFSPLRHVPGPLLARLTSKRGDVDTFSGKVAQNVQADSGTYGDIYVYKPNAVCISHPRDIRTILSSQEFEKGQFFDIFNDNGTPNIVSLKKPEQVSRRRRQIGPYFNYGYLSKMEALILRHGYIALKNKWDRLVAENNGNPTEVNYRIDTQLVTFDIMSVLAFGREVDSISKGSSSIIKWSSIIMSLLGSPIVIGLLSLLPFSLIMRPWKHMYRELAIYSKESLDMRKRILATGAEKPVDLLQAFIEAEDPESKTKMTPQEVQAESIMMMLAGSETTSSAIMWSFHLLMLYPETLKRAVEEVRSAFPLDHLVTYKEVHTHLPYIEACVYEALRHSPTTAGLTPRISTNKGITIQNHYIPPGTEIYVNLRSVNMHESVWNNPNRFDPDRFLNNDKAKNALFTFSYGPRICIGRNLAWVEMLTIIANVLKDYDLQLSRDSLYGPHNVDESGLPKLLPAKCFIASFPSYPERDCRMIITKRVE